MKRTPLSRGKPLNRSDGFKAPRTPMKRSRKRTGARRESDAKKRARFERNFRSVDRVVFIQGLPCVCDGVGEAWGCRGGKCQNSHDPSRGMGGAGGGYLDISPMTEACHRELGRGAKTFWLKIGKTREASNAETHAKWLGAGCHE